MVNAKVKLKKKKVVKKANKSIRIEIPRYALEMLN